MSDLIVYVLIWALVIGLGVLWFWGIRNDELRKKKVERERQDEIDELREELRVLRMAHDNVADLVAIKFNAVRSPQFASDGPDSPRQFEKDRKGIFYLEAV